MTEHPSIRVGDRERSCALSRLSIHFAEGYLSVDEFDEQAQRVAAATTQGELDGVFSDLPSPPTQEELKELKRARSLTAFPRERELENKLFRREIRDSALCLTFGLGTALFFLLKFGFGISFAWLSWPIIGLACIAIVAFAGRTREEDAINKELQQLVDLEHAEKVERLHIAYDRQQTLGL